MTSEAIRRHYEYMFVDIDGAILDHDGPCWSITIYYNTRYGERRHEVYTFANTDECLKHYNAIYEIMEED